MVTKNTTGGAVATGGKVMGIKPVTGSTSTVSIGKGKEPTKPAGIGKR